MKKRGLSTIVTSLILILLVLVAVGVVWIVVKNIISEGAEQVALGKLTMNLEIKQVSVNDGSVDVQVKRNSGAGELSGIKFIVSDGINTQVFEEPTTMAELGTQSFTLVYSGLVKEVSIAGIFETESGKEFTGNEIDKFEFSDEEVIKNINGLVSWWRFEGDAQDEVGENDGIINGADCNADGKYNRACEFDGVDDYVESGNNGWINTSITFAVWAKKYSNPSGYTQIAGDKGSNGALYVDNGGIIFFQLNIGGNKNSGITQSLGTDWNFWVGTWGNGETIKLYKNGILVSQSTSSYTGEISSFTGFSVAEYGSLYFNGLIDEVMIFNKALSEDEVKALYELDLS